MKISRRILASVAIAAAAMAGATAANANLLTNGSFETCSGADCTQTKNVAVLDGGSTSLTGWTVGQSNEGATGAVDWVGPYAVNNKAWTAADGSESVAFGAFAGASLSQTFATTAGHVYDVTFDLSGNPSGTTNPMKTLYVGTNLNDIRPYTFTVGSNSRTAMGWVGEEYSFTATGSSTTLDFFVQQTPGGGGQTPFNGPALDNVSAVLGVPEPATWAMMIVGLGLVGAGLRRRGFKTATSLA